MNYKKYLFIGLLLIGITLAVAACSPAEATPCPECPQAEECPTVPACPTCPEAPVCPEPVVADVPFLEEWTGSGHADASAEAFRHWDEDDPKEVPTSCATCHTPTGYVDFLGADGSAAGVVDVAQPVSNGITCEACHNDAAVALSEVTFPSGAVVSDLGPEARCMVCHQGRAAGSTVAAALEGAGLSEDLDTPSADLGFTNIHYYAAAATLYGSVTGGGYEYEGSVYDGKFMHEAGINTCIGCHNQHTLEIRLELCQECHTDVASVEDLRNVRMNGSLEDYDGDGDISEGIAAEITTLQEMLMMAIQAYGKEAGAPIAYNEAAYPYFFNDLNESGTVEEDEAVRDNGYASWTGRLLPAAYNYQLSLKDPGAFAHNAKYIIQLLHDSIADLNTQLSEPVDLEAASRLDAGHFAATEEAFRHWDEDGEVSGSCAKCHSAEGLPFFIKNGVSVAQHVSQGLSCETCHDVANFPAVYELASVKFPSGAEVTFGENAPANICLNCHQGRESTVSVNRVIGDNADDTVVEGLSFRNPHYFGAGASLFGTEAQGAYEYTGQTYLGHHPHVDLGQNCTTCHDTHELGVNVELCGACHGGSTEPDAIRMGTTDYDGDGDTSEGLAGEVETMEELLYAALQAYAAETAGTPIVYDAHAHPYFYTDTNADGVTDPEDVTSDTRYSTWTPRLLRGAYNYQWVQKDPGAFAHNGKYILQVLYDSLADLGADVSGMTRP